MTEKEAWEFLAEKFEDDKNNEYNIAGLCYGISRLSYNKEITQEIFHYMDHKIQNEIKGYWFDFDPNGKYSPTSQKLRAKKALVYSKLCTSG